jgi:hypothetical protein
MWLKRLQQFFKVKEPASTTSWMPVFEGQTCVGHVLSRGKTGYEAFDNDDRSRGLFPTKEAAIHAIAGEGR